MNKSQTIEQGKNLAMQVAIEVNAKIGNWETRGTKYWRYADFITEEKTLQIGVSSVGSVSIDGQPFDPEGQLNDNFMSVLTSVHEQLPSFKGINGKINIANIFGKSKDRYFGTMTYMEVESIRLKAIGTWAFVVSGDFYWACFTMPEQKYSGGNMCSSPQEAYDSMLESRWWKYTETFL